MGNYSSLFLLLCSPNGLGYLEEEGSFHCLLETGKSCKLVIMVQEVWSWCWERWIWELCWWLIKAEITWWMQGWEREKPQWESEQRRWWPWCGDEMSWAAGALCVACHLTDTVLLDRHALSTSQTKTGVLITFRRGMNYQKAKQCINACLALRAPVWLLFGLCMNTGNVF